MITITKFYARSFDLDHIDVFWEIGNFVGNIRQFEFTILRSESSMGPWDQLTPPFEDQFYFRDGTPLKMHKWRTLYYLLRIRDKITDEVVEIGPTSQAAEPDIITLEINRQEDLLFREFVGRMCWLFPVRTFGAYCICYDRVQSKRTKSNCLNCYDTGFMGGYLSPIQCYVQFDPSGQQSTPTTFKEKQDNKTSARLISFPQVKPKDILIEAENTRWSVLTMTPTQRLRAIVHQELTLKEVDKGDIEYKLPVNITDLKTLQPAAERNFTNPQHADGFADLNNIFAVYGYQPRGITR
jgi:hypothetical protein